MYKIQTLNKISPTGLSILPDEKYDISNDNNTPDAILVRSAKMHEMEMSKNLIAIARAGAGVNNIPLDKCAEKGIVVFNTPGANANGVKEIVIAALLLASRNVVPAIEWAKTLIGKGDEVPALIEKGKSNFAGTEIKGKTIGIIGLGAIGSIVALATKSLCMKVIGFDPFLSEEAEQNLAHNITVVKDINELFAASDYISLHVALTNDTKGMLNDETFKLMNKGVKIINMARGGLVDILSLKTAIDNGIVESYVTDFPDEDALKIDKVIAIPHLGASTEEAEDNCAVMAVEQLQNYLENGNIINSVNFPSCKMGKNFKTRISLAFKNSSNTIEEVTTVLGSENINIQERINKTKGDFSYSLINTESDITANTVEKLKAIKGIIKVRVINK